MQVTIKKGIPIEKAPDLVKELGEQLAQEKIKNMQLNSQVSNLGQQLAMVKLDVMKIKGGQSS
nr:XkdW family protein [Fredinandcohnia onubensis]